MSNSTAAERSIDNMFMMLFMTTVPALVTALVNLLTAYLPKIGDYLMSLVIKYILKPENSVSLRKTMTYSEKQAIWVTVVDEKHNHHLLSAVLEFIAEKQLHSTKMFCNLGETKSVPFVDDLQYSLTRTFEFIPSSEVIHDGFKITYELSSESKDNSGKRTQIITIASKKSVSEINAFINQCYTEYCTRHYFVRTVEAKQYLYKQMPTKEGIRFKKYEMNNKTTFDDLHFPEKEKILQLAKKLADGKLKKLSLLLHGAPGCGKSSIIKALAKHVGYHVVEVKLSFVLNDADLIDIFHNTSITRHKNNDEKLDTLTDNVPINKRIYILEDVDAECDVIHQRIETLPAKPDVELTKEERKLAKVEKKEKIKQNFYERYLEKRGVTLSGILNALDGILELNGAILVMTTNHVNKLDSAFIRPGRITLSIEMKKMLARDARKLIGQYFDDAESVKICDYVLTPATIEAFCQSSSNVVELQNMILHVS